MSDQVFNFNYVPFWLQEEKKRTSLLKSWKCYRRKTHFAQWCDWEIEAVLFFFHCKELTLPPVLQIVKKKIIILDVSKDRARVGVFNERWVGRKRGGPQKGRERSCCQTHNFAFTQRQLIKDHSSSTWLWINLSSLLWKSLSLYSHLFSFHPFHFFPIAV